MWQTLSNQRHLSLTAWPWHGHWSPPTISASTGGFWRPLWRHTRQGSVGQRSPIFTRSHFQHYYLTSQSAHAPRERHVPEITRRHKYRTRLPTRSRDIGVCCSWCQFPRSPRPPLPLWSRRWRGSRNGRRCWRHRTAASGSPAPGCPPSGTPRRRSSSVTGRRCPRQCQRCEITTPESERVNIVEYLVTLNYNEYEIDYWVYRHTCEMLILNIGYIQSPPWRSRCCRHVCSPKQRPSC